MKRKLTIVLLFVIAIAFAFPLAAGGSSESDEEALEFWCYWDKGHPNDLWMRQIIDDFEKETGIKVNYSNPGANILLSVAPAIVDGNAPDLIDGHCIEMIASLGNDGLLLPLEDLYSGTTWDGSGTFESQFIEGTTTQGMYDGERWFVPYCAHTSCFHYNKAEFEKRGWEIPETWDDFIAMCDELVAEGIAPIGLDNTPLYNAYWFYWFMERICGTGAFWELATDPTGAAWDNPDVLRAAQMVADVSKYFINGWMGNVWPAGQIAWAQGSAIFHLDGSYIANELFDKVDENFEFGAFPFPAIEGGKGDPASKEISVMGFAVPKDAKHPDLAKKFIQFALQPKYQISMMETYYPTTLVGLDDEIPDYIKDVYAIITSDGPVHMMYDGLQSRGEWWSTVFYPVDNDLIYGNITPEEFVSRLKADTVAYLNK